MLLDVSRHRDGLDVFQALKARPLTPVQEPANRMMVRNSGVLVAGWNGKEPEKPLGQPRQRSQELGTIQLWRRSRQEFSHHLGNVCAIAIPFHLQDHVFGSTEYLYGDYPNEAGPKATRSEIGVISD